MRTEIQTARLILRPFHPSDVEAAFTWFGDPVVMQFTVTGPDKSIEDTRRRLAYFDEHQRVHGFSKWIILGADSGTAIGDSGLLVLEDYGWIDLGFRLVQRYWGKGLATGIADPARPLELCLGCGLQRQWQAPRHRQLGQDGEGIRARRPRVAQPSSRPSHPNLHFRGVPTLLPVRGLSAFALKAV